MAAPSLVQSTGKEQQFTVTTLVKAFPGSTTPGNFIVVKIYGHSIAPFLAGQVTDSQGNTYTLAVQDNNGTQSPACGIYSAANTLGGACTITYTPASSTNCWMDAEEWSNMGSGPTIMATSAANGTSTTPNTGATSSVAPPADGALAVATMAIVAATTTHTVDTVSPAWSQDAEHLGAGGSNVFAPPGECDSRVITATGTQSCGWTVDVSGGWTAAIVVFAPGIAPIKGSAVFGVTTTVKKSRAVAFGLDDNVNVLDEAGKLKIFGDLEVTGTSTFAVLDASTSALQRIEIALTSADLLALRATPKTLVAAPGAGLLLEFVSLVLFLDATATAYVESAANLGVRYTNGSGAQLSETIEATGFIDQTADTMTTGRPKLDAIVAKSGCENKALVLHNLGAGEYTTGTGVVRAKVSYRVWTTGW